MDATGGILGVVCVLKVRKMNTKISLDNCMYQWILTLLHLSILCNRQVIFIIYQLMCVDSKYLVIRNLVISLMISLLLL